MKVNSNEWDQFKTNETDETFLIGQAIKEFSLVVHGEIIDIGGGIGDIVSHAFPNNNVTIVDVNEFPKPENKLHVRHKASFYDLNHRHMNVELMIFSHVTQYIDEDSEALLEKVEQLRPKSIILVRNVMDEKYLSLLNWLHEHSVRINPELEISSFPGVKYQIKKRTAIVGAIEVRDFSELADRLIKYIFDGAASKATISNFSEWLSMKLDTPRLELPQTIEYFERI